MKQLVPSNEATGPHRRAGAASGLELSRVTIPIGHSVRVARFTGSAIVPGIGGYRAWLLGPLARLVIDPPAVDLRVVAAARWFFGAKDFHATASDLRADAVRRGRTNGVRMTKTDRDWLVFWGSQRAVLDALENAGAVVNRTPSDVTLSDLG